MTSISERRPNFDWRLVSTNAWAWLRRRARAQSGLLREPLTHFIVAGALIFFASEVVEHYTSRYRIVLGPEQEMRLSATFEQQYGYPPSPAELATLTRNWLNEEMQYREATALG